ncbi:hypothetical protein [Streptomyces justiciae]|uniref:Uncharacterized protein n=1 Tax=Streptomyces justiciae TaxID=2780140 RepID=A0ABU3LZL0_9ACTN|nr:hypothetical protein [Streptomyces justiciae]MDT7844670.1 hypothetical protein [Streptomyces justiciae]
MTDAMSGPQKGQGDGSPLVAGHEGEGRGFAQEREKAPLVASHEAAGRDAHGGRLLADEQCDKLSGELQHAMAGFVDGPRAAVEEADHVLEEVTSRFTDAMAQRRRTLRQSWQGAQHGDGKPMAEGGASGDTEQLRLALRDYRELTERLLKL